MSLTNAIGCVAITNVPAWLCFSHCLFFPLPLASCVGGEKEMVKGLVQWDIVLMHKLSPCLHHPQSRAFALVNTQ